MKPPGPIRFVHYQPAHQTMSNNTPIQGAMEAARPAVQNWSLLEEVVSLLLSLLVFVQFFAHPDHGEYSENSGPLQQLPCPRPRVCLEAGRIAPDPVNQAA